mgnify:CR=1 FL=1
MRAGYDVAAVKVLWVLAMAFIVSAVSTDDTKHGLHLVCGSVACLGALALFSILRGEACR